MSKPKAKPYNPFTVDSTETARQALLVRRAELKEEIESLPPGPCAFCGQTIPADKRPDSKFCSASCRVDASLQRGLKINHATFMAANQRAAKSEICALRLRARAEYLRKLVVADAPQTKPAPIPAPPAPVPAGPVRTWGAAPPRDPNAPPIVFLFDDEPEDTTDSFESDRLAAESADNQTATE